MENRFSNCCFNFELVGQHSEFSVYREKSLGLHCYCLNCHELGQYWRCIIEDCNFLCKSQCGRCSICSEMSHIFTKLQDVYFFSAKRNL